MPGESVKKTILVALGVCIACSVLVSAAAVSLQGIQEENRRLDRIRNILLAGNLLKDNEDISATYARNVKPELIELGTGRTVPERDAHDRLNVQEFSIKAVADDAQLGMAVSADSDTAGIKRMPRYMVVYHVGQKGTREKIVLPVYGKGLWSTMYGFIALAHDLTTVEGFTFYEHAETPGLGGEVDNPRWKKSWQGKQVFDENGRVAIEVIKGKVDASRQEARYKVDGLSGATITSRGVSNLVRFWLGEKGYGPFLARLRSDYSKSDDMNNE